ncbi:MAG: D-2-hydroxyacid dehydrogenase [Paenibacillaceae bacterium]|nr:D-2-hydroxyacid dehydrogenase [Paenibacillaceae bacterium]
MIVIINRFVNEHERRISPQLAEQLARRLQEPVWLADSVADAARQAADADIVVGFNPKIDAADLEQFPRLRWMHSMTSGVDRMPLARLAERGVLVTNSRGIHRTQIAEQMIGTMISFTRRLHLNIRNQLQARWDVDYVPEQLAGRTIAIVGAGSIGCELARKCKAFDMRVAGVRQTAGDLEHFDQMVAFGGLPELLPVSDFVAVLLPLTPGTRHAFGRTEFALMKRSAIFLNFSRGGVVDETALVDALRQGEIAGAGLDVFSEEPLPSDHPLWSMEQVILSPHSSGLTAHLEMKEMELFGQLASLFRNDGEMFNVIRPEQRY